MCEINEIGARLRELRETSDYTVEQLAAELNVSPEVYRSYEQNGRDIPISVIYEVANKFGVDFAEIVTGTPARLDTYHMSRGAMAGWSTGTRNTTLRIWPTGMPIK